MNDRQANSAGWFEEKARVEVIKFQDLLTALESGEIGLPSFQRGRAWGPARIAFLWDSLLRGYPMGSLMVIPSGNLSDDQKRGQQQGGSDKQNLQWLLLDGQQRCATIALAAGQDFGATGDGGRSPGPMQRLWVDLAAFQGGIPGMGQRSPFYLTTFAHPWGIGVKDGAAEAATEGYKQTGRECLANWAPDTGESGPDGIWRARPTNKDDNPQWKYRWAYPDPWLNLQYTWPVEAEVPVPVDELVSRLREDGERELSAAHLPDLFVDPELWDQGPGRAATDLDEPLKRVCNALRGILEYEVVLIQVPKEDSTNEQDAPERLNDVFQRINRQGAALSDAELFFSTVKMHHPGAHDDVERIHQDPATGKVLDPLQIVHGAARLARSEPDLESAGEPDELSDLPRLTLSRYKSLVRDPEGGKGEAILERLVIYLQNQVDTDTRNLHDTLKSLREALSYRPEERGPEKPGSSYTRDIGLPLPLLAQLSWRVWHTLVAWGVERNKETIKKNRKALIRYALVYHFFNNSTAEWGIRYPFLAARLKGRNADRFPDGEVLADLNKHGYLYGYLPGRDAEYSYPTGILRPKHYNSYATRLYDWILQNERDLLLWSQRDAVHRWFDDLYDPLHHVRTDETPFDIDHIVPNDWFMNVRSKCNQFDDIWWVKDSIGNLRVWPQSLNRSEGNRRLSKRWLVGERNEQNEPDENHYKFWGLEDSGKILADSAIDPGKDVPELQKVDVQEDGDRKDWTTAERCEAFRTFANNRRCRLYRAFFETLNLNELEGALCDAELPPAEASGSGM